MSYAIPMTSLSSLTTELSLNTTLAFGLGLTLGVITRVDLLTSLGIGMLGATAFAISELTQSHFPTLSDCSFTSGVIMTLALLGKNNLVTVLTVGGLATIVEAIRSLSYPYYKKICGGENWKAQALEILTVILLAESGTRFCSSFIPIHPLSVRITQRFWGG